MVKRSIKEIKTVIAEPTPTQEHVIIPCPCMLTRNANGTYALCLLTATPMGIPLADYPETVSGWFSKDDTGNTPLDKFFMTIKKHMEYTYETSKQEQTRIIH